MHSAAYPFTPNITIYDVHLITKAQKVQPAHQMNIKYSNQYLFHKKSKIRGPFVKLLFLPSWNLGQSRRTQRKKHLCNYFSFNDHKTHDQLNSVITVMFSDLFFKFPRFSV